MFSGARRECKSEALPMKNGGELSKKPVKSRS